MAQQEFIPQEPGARSHNQNTLTRFGIAAGAALMTLTGAAMNINESAQAGGESADFRPAPMCGPGEISFGTTPDGVEVCGPSGTPPPVSPDTDPSTPTTHAQTPTTSKGGSTTPTTIGTKTGGDKSGNQTTTTTLPEITADLDGDGYPSVYVGYDKINNGYDADDSSTGTGDAGVDLLKADMAARGLSWDALTPDEQALYSSIAKTVAADTFATRMPAIYGVAVTTTTQEATTSEVTTTQAPTTEVVNSVIKATSTTVNIDTTVQTATETTDTVAAVVVANEDKPKEDGNNMLPLELAGGAGVAALTVGLIGYRRSRKGKSGGSYSAPTGGSSPQPGLLHRRSSR